MWGRLAEVGRRIGPKVKACKSNVMVLNGEEGVVLEESGTDGAECSRKIASWRRVAGAIRSLVNPMYFQLDCS